MSDSLTDQAAQLKQTIAALEAQERALSVDLSISLNQLRELLRQIEQPVMPAPPVVPAWGARLNWPNEYLRLQTSSTHGDCPTWLNWQQKEDWDDRGLVVWNEEVRQLHRFWAEQALGILEKLRTTDEWHSVGVILTQTTRRHNITPAPPQPKQQRKKRGSEPMAASFSSTQLAFEEVEEECLRLPISAGAEFLAFLGMHEATLRKMADEDKQKRDEAIGEVYGLLLRAARRSEAAEIDLTTRRLPWVRDQFEMKFICDRPPNRVTIARMKNDLAWQAYLEQPNRFKRESPWFCKLEEAFNWGEEKILAAEQEPREPIDLDDEPLPAAGAIDLVPYWIAPAVLEPKQVTYRITVYIEREPTEFKKMEMSFGKFMKYDEEFPGPLALARELNIDSIQMIVEQISPHFGFYRAKSNVVYFTESLAAAQAQVAWEHSSLVKTFQDGKIVRARYGYEEVETGYETYLGGCEKPDITPLNSSTRSEYMARQAMRLTLVYSLDLNGFRAHLGINKKLQNDVDLMEWMHEERARSIYIPEQARAESRQWLAEHKQSTTKGVRDR